MVDYQESFLEKIVNVHWPNKGGFLVICYFGNVSSSDNGGSTAIFQWPNDFGPKFLSGPGGLGGKNISDQFTITQGKDVAGQTWRPFRNNKESQADGQFWDYTAGTVVAGLKGAPFSIRNAAVGHGSNGSEVFADGKEQILEGWMTEFGWDHSTAESNIGFMMFLLEFLQDIGAAPPNTFNPPLPDPADFDPNAVTFLHGFINHSLSITKQNAMVLNLGKLAEQGATEYEFELQLTSPHVGNYNIVTMWTSKKALPKGSLIAAPSGWGVNALFSGPDDNSGFNTFEGPLVLAHPGEGSFPWTTPTNFDGPEGYQDYREFAFSMGGEVFSTPTTTIRVVVDLKTMKFTFWDTLEV